MRVSKNLPLLHFLKFKEPLIKIKPYISQQLKHQKTIPLKKLYTIMSAFF